MLDTLTALDLPHGDLVVPAIRLDPATMISYGVISAPGNTASFGHRQIDHLHVAPDEATEYAAVATRSAEVASELLARLVADHRAATGLRCAITAVGWFTANILSTPDGAHRNAGE
jgi:hypothetical protein